jgi:hypothetical protein
MSINILHKYDEYVDYVADGYAQQRSLSKQEVLNIFSSYNVDRFLIDTYHPLARHNRRYISRKIDGFLQHRGYTG